MSSVDAWFVESHSSHSRVTLRNCNFFGGAGLFPGTAGRRWRYLDLRDCQAPQAGTVRTMFHII